METRVCGIQISGTVGALPPAAVGAVAVQVQTPSTNLGIVTVGPHTFAPGANFYFMSPLVLTGVSGTNGDFISIMYQDKA